MKMGRLSVCLYVTVGAVFACSSTGAHHRVSPGIAPVATAPAAGSTALARLNQLIEDSWKSAHLVPSAAADDGEFLRRVSLDLVGRIPSLDETKSYSADNAPDKRARLVNLLLVSHEFAEHWADIYSDLLFGSDLKPKFEKEYNPRAWLVHALEENIPYDRMMTALVTATGDLRENGALGFLFARVKGGGGTEAVTGAAARIFLGLQIQCAQCHDHPYDPQWKQEDFYGLVAYFARARVKNEKSMGDKSYAVVDMPRGQAKMRKPRTELDVVVQPRFLGHQVAERPNETRRQTLARAIVGSDLFAKAMVGRTWTQLFGHGLVDPWDDLGGENDPKHPAVLNRLAQDFRDSAYDIRGLLRTITLSTAYARTSARSPAADEAAVLAATRGFAQAGIRPLSPEQMFRSMLTATGVSNRGGGKKVLPPDAIAKRQLAALKEYIFVFGDDEMAEANTFDGSVPQSLLLLNGELTNAGTRAGRAGVLGQILAAHPESTARLDDMFQAVYSRIPSAAERAPFLDFLGGRNGARSAYEDVYFSLMTSTEAITNH